MKISEMNIKVQRVYRLQDNPYIKAFVDISINDALLIKSLRVVNGKKGLFVSMPQEQAKDKKWYDRVLCLTDDMREQITREVLTAFNEESN